MTQTIQKMVEVKSFGNSQVSDQLRRLPDSREKGGGKGGDVFRIVVLAIFHEGKLHDSMRSDHRCCTTITGTEGGTTIDPRFRIVLI